MLNVIGIIVCLVAIYYLYKYVEWSHYRDYLEIKKLRLTRRCDTWEEYIYDSKEIHLKKALGASKSLVDMSKSLSRQAVRALEDMSSADTPILNTGKYYDLRRHLNNVKLSPIEIETGWRNNDGDYVTCIYTYTPEEVEYMLCGGSE